MSYPFYQQEYEWDCSLACILMIASYYHGKKYNYSKISRESQCYQDLNLDQIEKIGNQYGVIFEPFYARWRDFVNVKIRKPLICQLVIDNKFHFIVIYRRFWKWFLIADPQSKNPQWISRNKLQKKYSGVVLDSNATIPNKIFDQKNKSLIYWNKLGWTTFLTLIVSLLVTGIIIGNQFLFKIFIDEILNKRSDTIINNWLKAFVLFFVVKQFLGLILQKMIEKIEIDHKKSWTMKFFRRVHMMNYYERKQRNSAWFLQNSMNLSDVLTFYFPTSFVFLQNFFVLVVSIFVVICVQPFLALIIVFFVVLITTIWILLIPWKKNMEWTVTTNNEKFNNTLIEIIENSEDRKRRNLDWISWENLMESYQENKTVLIKKRRFQRWQNWFYQIIRFSMKFALIYLLLLQPKKDLVSPGMFIFLFFLSNNIIQRSQNLISYFFDNERIKKMRENFDDFLPMKPEKATDFFEINKNIELKIINLNYSYDQIHFLWKKNMNQTIDSHTYLNGLPGAGKSTFLQLINGELQSKTGVIRYNNKLVNEIERLSWKKQIFHISAKSQVLSGTIIDNIFNFRKNTKNSKLWKTYQIKKWLDLFQLEPKIEIGKKKISNGQRQLIVFLSIFFSSARIILIDEGLNSIPSNFKIKLLKNLFFHRPNSLVLYAGHDPKLISIFPKKILIKNNEN